MANCCNAQRCTCRVTAGPGVTVEGNGSLATPYVVSAAGAATALGVTDTPTVDLTLTGTGAASDPYEVSASVILDPTPPGGGTNLLEAGPDGLFVECADVRTCFTAGDGAAYNPTTGEISARLSADAGNTTVFGGDGGLYTAAASTDLQGTDTTSIDVTVSGSGTAADPYDVSAAVILDSTPPGGGSNLIEEGPDGLYVECADVRTCFSAGDGAAYDPASGEISARVSADAGNTVVFGADGGLYSAGGGGGTPTVVTAGDTTTANNTVSGTGTAGDPYVVTTDVIVDPAPPAGGTNLLQVGPDGLYVECADVRGCFSAGDGAAYDPATGEISARLSADAGNTTVFGADGGLYTPAASTALEAADTPTVDVTVTGTGTAADPYQVAAAVILDPAPPGGGANLLEEGPDGLYVECADVRTCITAGDGAAYTPGTGEVEARLSTDAGNQVAFGTDGGLFVPPDAPLEIGCGLQGDGTAATPLTAFPIAGSQPWTDDWNCDPVANSTLKCDPTSGALWTPPEHASAAVTLQQNHPLGTPTIGVTGGFVLVDSTAWSEGTYTADSLSACRGISFSTRFTGHVELTWPANAQFDLGYAVQINGGGLAVRQTHSVLANGPARHERYSFGVAQAAVLPPHTGYSVRVYPAVRVTAGTVTFNQWITDTDLIAMTR
ncbi:hypothetical protein [Streptomyces olivochromogenes]|uniref:hypothetical protein n=1 Tax=Streptomyces olivochromogenes TaxID=1963 RepID=UPI0036A45C02